jgi:hypothetical protein
MNVVVEMLVVCLFFFDHQTPDAPTCGPRSLDGRAWQQLSREARSKQPWKQAQLTEPYEQLTQLQ